MNKKCDEFILAESFLGSISNLYIYNKILSQKEIVQSLNESLSTEMIFLNWNEFADVCEEEEEEVIKRHIDRILLTHEKEEERMSGSN